MDPPHLHSTPHSHHTRRPHRVPRNLRIVCRPPAPSLSERRNWDEPSSSQPDQLASNWCWYSPGLTDWLTDWRTGGGSSALTQTGPGDVGGSLVPQRHRSRQARFGDLSSIIDTFRTLHCPLISSQKNKKQNSNLVIIWHFWTSSPYEGVVIKSNSNVFLRSGHVKMRDCTTLVWHYLNTFYLDHVVMMALSSGEFSPDRSVPVVTRFLLSTDGLGQYSQADGNQYFIQRLFSLFNIRTYIICYLIFSSFLKVEGHNNHVEV